MSYADQVFMQNIREILDHGVWDTDQNVRPHWEDGTPAPASVPRHVLARWQSQCGGTSHHTHRGAVQERGWTFDPTHHGTVQGPTGRMAFFIRNGGMMRRSI